jgi:hypothetical protein
LFAKDMQRVASFYAAALNLRELERDDEHVHLMGPGLDLVVRQIPAALAAAIRIDHPPSRRDDVPVKLVFYLSDICHLRETLSTHGGILDPSPKPWLFDGCEVWDALDPEGNVVQFRIPSVEPTS